jgi:hypothetical protein
VPRSPRSPRSSRFRDPRSSWWGDREQSCGIVLSGRSERAYGRRGQAMEVPCVMRAAFLAPTGRTASGITTYFFVRYSGTSTLVARHRPNLLRRSGWSTRFTRHASWCCPTRYWLSSAGNGLCMSVERVGGRLARVSVAFRGSRRRIDGLMRGLTGKVRVDACDHAGTGMAQVLGDDRQWDTQCEVSPAVGRQQISRRLLPGRCRRRRAPAP